MFAFLPDPPGIDDVRTFARRVDTARHHGVPKGCVLELDLRVAPPEAGGVDPLTIISGGGRPLVLREAVSALHRAADDPRVAGLIARVQLPAAAAGPVQELRDAVKAFTAVKPSLAWAETYPGTLSYYLASAFGEVWMQPSGTVGLIGFATNALFLRDALEKAGIEAQFIARGEYKSAANLFTQARYTDAHREADTRLLESLRAQVWKAVADSRGIGPDSLDALADRAPLLREDAVTSGLIDRVGYRDEAYARIAELVGAEGITPETGDADGDDAPPRLYLSRYARSTAPGGSPLPPVPGRRRKSTFAVVTVAGPIVSGRGGRGIVPFGNSSAGADTIAAGLREAAADDSVSAIVLRVDSPGGSVSASETIWREVKKARERGKAVVASMGAVAASGGYYVAMGADAVVAPFTPEQHAQVEAEADLFYDDFVQRVAQGRHLSVEAVETVARGRIWTGADALDHGLVDELGGLRAAVRRAKVLVGLDTDAKVRLIGYPGSSLWDFLRPQPSSQPAAASLPDALGALITQSVVGIIEQAERSFTGVSALWLGESRF